MGGTVLWPAKQLMEYQFKFLIPLQTSDFSNIYRAADAGGGCLTRFGSFATYVVCLRTFSYETNEKVIDDACSCLFFSLFCSEGNIHDVYNYVEWALAYLFNLRSADSGGEPSGCILFTRT